MSHDNRWALRKAVGVDFAERIRIAVGGKFVGHRNGVIAQALDAMRDRRTARIDAQDGGDDRIEALRPQEDCSRSVRRHC